MEKQSSTFSIIVPTYARPVQLAHCVQSLSVLEYPHHLFEVIVVDDGSSKSLSDIISRLRGQLDVTLIEQQVRGGPAKARNTGAAQARGNFLAFTDDDCRPRPDWLQNLAARFAETPDHLVGGRTLNSLQDNPYSSASQLILDIVYSYYNANINGPRFFASNNLALPTDGFHALGGFDPTFKTSEDRDLCDRWLQRGYRMTYAPEAVVYHAHKLTLLTFWRQHFGYGRGAFRFHQLRARRGTGRFRPEAPFYISLLRYPFLGEHGRPGLLPILAVWQLANAAGFLWEMTSRRKDADKPLTSALYELKNE
jgi:GT2 family glycosyltransferase